MNSYNDFPTENIDATDVPVWSAPELPEKAYLPLVVEQDDPSCPGTMLALYNLNIDRVTPGGSFQTGTYSLARKTATRIQVPEKQVIPAYVQTTQPNMVIQASASSPTTLAQFLIISEDPNDEGRYLIQGDGFYSFPDTHGYIIGYDYYLDEASGKVTTQPPTNAQRLFTVIDNKTILIGIGR